MKLPQVAPSILTADFADLQKEILSVVDAGCELLHLDVMDGHFVPNITFGPALIASLRKKTGIAFDMHMMISEPKRYLEPFAKACGKVEGSIYTFHYEVEKDPLGLIRQIHDLGLLAGMAINPATPAEAVKDALPYLDMILVMTVNPGYGGQGLIASCPPKVHEIREMAKAIGKQILIEVDGGIKPNNVDLVREADLIVMGSAVFKDSDEKAAFDRFQIAQKAIESVYVFQ